VTKPLCLGMDRRRRPTLGQRAPRLRFASLDRASSTGSFHTDYTPVWSCPHRCSSRRGAPFAVCGIAVSVDLERRGRGVPWALAALRHRGPDSEHAFRDSSGNVALEHCRLAIIDPDNREADQPFFDPSGRWAIVYNGEVFNFAELRERLEKRGVKFRTRSDTEVVLLGFIEEGERVLERLRGMYAFVIWDRETNDLFAARDQIGVKPLYYAVQDGIFAAASEIRPLLAHPHLEASLDPGGVVEFLSFGNNFGERTLVQGIRKLRPGHFLRISAGRVTISEYWDVLPPDGPAPTAEAAHEELLDRLDEALRYAMVSDVPIAFALSGGLDSSTITTLATRHATPSHLTAYSIAFGESDDEAVVAARLARDLGVRHRVIQLSSGELGSAFDDWLATLDYPCGNPTWIAVSFIARAAHEDGIKVLLSGDGGDELFGGYTRWMKYLRFHARVWKNAPRPVRRAAGLASRPWARGLAGDIARRASAGGDLFVPSRPFHDDLLARCLGPAGAAAAAADPPETSVEELRRRFRERLPGGDYLAWMSYVSLKTHLVEDFLQRLDKMAMQHSVEGRVPLLDPLLARWAFRLPQKLKVPRFREKALFRSAVTPLLPLYILERPKQGFCPPVERWATELLRTRRPLDGSILVDSGLIDADRPDLVALTGNNSFAAWTLGTLAEWSRRNLGARQPVAAAER
jgi:asparagine synthase (glutamine-hydrolysing)